MNDIYVLDTETTGLGGISKGDLVLEIGIARVDLCRERVYPEFSKIVHYDYLSGVQMQSWVFQNTDFTPDDVTSSPWSLDQVSRLLQNYEDKVFTAYNVEFDFGRYLHNSPWNFHPKLAPCIMEEYAAIYGQDGRWCKAQEAYDRLCPDNPAELPDGIEQHRALSDAVCEGNILLGLCDDIEVFEKYMEVLNGPL